MSNEVLRRLVREECKAALREVLGEQRPAEFRANEPKLGTEQTQYGGVRVPGIDDFYFIIPPAGDPAQAKANTNGPGGHFFVFQGFLGGHSGGLPFFVPYYHFDLDSTHPHGGLPTRSERIPDHAFLHPGNGEDTLTESEIIDAARRFAAEERANQRKRQHP